MSEVLQDGRSVDVDFYTRDNEIIEKDGDLYVKGVASTGDTDTNSDIVTDRALGSMLNWIRQGKVNLHYDHKHTLDGIIGSIVQAEIIGNQLFITSKILPSAKEMIKEYIRNGISLGLSVGGKAIRSPVNPHIIDDYILMEISITPIPSLVESKGTFHEVEFPTCVSGACYLAMNEQDRQLNNLNYTNIYDNKSYIDTNEVNTMNQNAYNNNAYYNDYNNAYNSPYNNEYSETFNESLVIQELEEMENILCDKLEQVAYNNKYGFDNKAHADDLNEIIDALDKECYNVAYYTQTPYIPVREMLANISQEDIKQARDELNHMSNADYQKEVADAKMEGMVPKNLNVKFLDHLLGILGVVNGVASMLQTGSGVVSGVKNLFGIGSKNEPAQQVPHYDYDPQGGYEFSRSRAQYYPPDMNRIRQRARNPSFIKRPFSSLNRKSFNMVGEPAGATGLDDYAQTFSPEQTEQLEQMVMRMINEAFVQKTDAIAQQVENDVMQKMNAGGSMDGMNPMQQGQGQDQMAQAMQLMQDPEMLAQLSQMIGGGEVPPEEDLKSSEPTDVAVPEVPNQNATEIVEPVEEVKAEENKENVTYNFPQPPYYEQPFYDVARAEVPDSKSAKMQKAIEQTEATKKENTGTGFTKNRNEYGEFIG